MTTKNQNLYDCSMSSAHKKPSLNCIKKKTFFYQLFAKFNDHDLQSDFIHKLNSVLKLFNHESQNTIFIFIQNDLNYFRLSTFILKTNLDEHCAFG